MAPGLEEFVSLTSFEENLLHRMSTDYSGSLTDRSQQYRVKCKHQRNKPIRVQSLFFLY